VDELLRILFAGDVIPCFEILHRFGSKQITEIQQRKKQDRIRANNEAFNKESKKVEKFQREAGPSMIKPAKYTEIPTHNKRIRIDDSSRANVHSLFLEKPCICFRIIASQKTETEMIRQYNSMVKSKLKERALLNPSGRYTTAKQKTKTKKTDVPATGLLIKKCCGYLFLSAF
jgi:sensor c-di-GMP phosphodiesterase-like protein